MYIIFAVAWKVEVDDDRDLLYVNTSGQQIGRDKHTRRARTKLSHDDITFVLFHVAVPK